MKHLCVFIAYELVHVIKTSFDSLYTDEIDFFIIENNSDNSPLIEDYFEDKKVKGYIQFERNIANNAVNIFIRDFISLMEEYDIITITDGDIYVIDVKEMFKEILSNLNLPDVIVSSSSKYLGNHYEDKKKIIGIDKFKEKMSEDNLKPGPIVRHHGIILFTIKKENLSLIQNEHFLDSILWNKVVTMGKKWVSTLGNLSYHLTWDEYIDGNYYYEMKKANQDIWMREAKSRYRRIR